MPQKKSNQSKSPTENDLRGEALRSLVETKFDAHRLRIISDLTVEEYCFTSVPDENIPIFLEYELLRESIDIHRRISSLRGVGLDDLSNENINQTKIGPRFLNSLQVMLEFVEYFPLPMLSIQNWNETNKLNPSHSRDTFFRKFAHPDALQEVPLDYISSRLAPDNAPQLEYIHAFHFNLEFHTNGEVLKAFKKWLDTKRPQGGVRPSFADNLNQLAAWRARRAGLSHNDFVKLNPKPKQVYADASAFRNACTAAEAEILRTPPM